MDRWVDSTGPGVRLGCRSAQGKVDVGWGNDGVKKEGGRNLCIHSKRTKQNESNNFNA